MKESIFKLYSHLIQKSNAYKVGIIDYFESFAMNSGLIQISMVCEDCKQNYFSLL